MRRYEEGGRKEEGRGRRARGREGLDGEHTTSPTEFPLQSTEKDNSLLPWKQLEWFVTKRLFRCHCWCLSTKWIKFRWEETESVITRIHRFFDMKLSLKSHNYCKIGSDANLQRQISASESECWSLWWLLQCQMSIVWACVSFPFFPLQRC